MSRDASPLHADYYADRACFAPATVLENVQTARDTFRMRIDAAGIAQEIVPGQFIMVRLAGRTDPMLGRAFALYDIVHGPAGRAVALDFVYLKKGKLTTPLSTCEAGSKIELWGPLGNGFRHYHTDHLIMVAGGIGQTPFLALGKEALGTAQYAGHRRYSPAVPAATLCYGVRTANLLAGEEDFRGAGIDLQIASDDGSVGLHGRVTELLEKVLTDSRATSPQVVCCGPEPMMQATSLVCRDHGVPCEVSLETPMACGIGICFSCVAKIHQADGDWDYKRTCVEGPVFDAEKVLW